MRRFIKPFKDPFAIWEEDPENCSFKVIMGYDHWEIWMVYKNKKKYYMDAAHSLEWAERILNSFTSENENLIRKKQNHAY